jgi:hypothetical protein
LTSSLLSTARQVSTSVVFGRVGDLLLGELLELRLGQQHRVASSLITMQAAVSSVNCG